MHDNPTSSNEVAPQWTFSSIYGGEYSSADLAGKPILLVNTASLCGFTPQYAGLQKLYDTYKAEGLVVLAVPSDDFDQEKADDEEVKTFCERTFGINLPMTVISSVKGRNAHPLYQWLHDKAGFTPEWNFDKVLLDRSGRVAGTWRSVEEPLGGAIEQAVQRAVSAG
ncbi:MAG: glutathione peroxidase [Paracoccaceae bacterium]